MRIPNLALFFRICHAKEVNNIDLLRVFILLSASTYPLISRQIAIFDHFCVKNAQKYGQIRNPYAILRRHVPNQKVKISFFGDPGVSTFEKFELKIDHSQTLFFSKIIFCTILATVFKKRRVPSENIDDFPSIDLLYQSLPETKRQMAGS